MKKSKKILDLLNEHYVKNLELGIFYNILNVKLQKMSMPNFAKYIKNLSDDKLTIHKDKITDYLSSVDGEISIWPTSKFLSEVDNLKSPLEIIKKVYLEENLIREDVTKFANECIKESDFESFNFIQWFVEDGLKDFGEIEYINGLFENSKDHLLIDMNIEKVIE